MNVDYDPFEGWEVRASRASCSRAARPSTRTARSSPQPGRGRFVKRSIFEPAVALMACSSASPSCPDPPYQRLVELIVKAESLGFDSGWTYDSPILWQEPYPLITLLARRDVDGCGSACA